MSMTSCVQASPDTPLGIIRLSATILRPVINSDEADPSLRGLAYCHERKTAPLHDIHTQADKAPQAHRPMCVAARLACLSRADGGNTSTPTIAHLQRTHPARYATRSECRPVQ